MVKSTSLITTGIAEVIPITEIWVKEFLNRELAELVLTQASQDEES